MFGKPGIKARLSVLTGLLVVAVVAGGCSATRAENTEVPRTAAVAVEPGDGAVDVAPASPIRATVKHGSFREIALFDANGAPVPGELSPDGSVWQPTVPLSFGATYSWHGHAIGQDGRPVEVRGTFRTAQPEQEVSATITPQDGDEVGIAMPIRISFDQPVKDKAAVERALSVETSVPVEGSWGWLSDTQVDWRPKEYWPPHTHVKVTGELYGLPYGDGAFGAEDISTEFDIGRAQIVKADPNTHRLVVEQDGQQVADYPASYGAEYDPGRHTPNGTFIVMSKSPVERMTSEEYGYDVYKTWAVRFSNHGEYIHENEENSWALGEVNNSHGCINLSAADAKEFFESALIGDPVEVTGSGSDMEPGYDVYDWLLSWEEWQELSAL